MYINAEDVLLKDLLQKVQDYVQGTEIYIPKTGKIFRLG